jgi:hypothetical protein
VEPAALGNPPLNVLNGIGFMAKVFDVRSDRGHRQRASCDPRAPARNLGGRERPDARIGLTSRETSDGGAGSSVQGETLWRHHRDEGAASRRAADTPQGPSTDRPAALRATRLATALLLLFAVAAGPARADAEADLFDLVTAWESASICEFPLSEEAAAQLDATIAAFQGELGRTDAEMADLREQAAWGVLRQRTAMCAADGSWRARYDEILAAATSGGGGGGGGGG